MNKTNVTEEQLIDVIFSCVEIRGIDLNDYKHEFTNENTGLYSQICKLFDVEPNYPELEEDIIPFTYANLKQKLDWATFCDLTGISYYAKNVGYTINDREIFDIKESDAKKYNLI